MGHGGSLGLALGGGGLRGLAHLGILRVLQREGLEPRAVTGTSAGSMVAALWAAEWDVEDMIHVALRLRPRDVLDYVFSWKSLAYAVLDFMSVARIPDDLPKGFIRGELLQKRFHRWTGGIRLDQIRRPVAIVATDLDDGSPVVFTPPAYREAMVGVLPGCRCECDAPLSLAVRASCAIPGCFEPVAWRGRTLVDGAVTDRVPVRPLRALRPDLSVAVDVCTGSLPRRGFWDVFAQVHELVTRKISDEQKARYADVLLCPPVSGVRLTQLGHAPSFIRAGAITCREAMPEIRRRLRMATPAADGTGEAAGIAGAMAVAALSRSPASPAP